MRFQSNIQRLTSFLLFLSAHSGAAATWWHLSQYDPNSAENPKLLCSLVPNLDARQRRMCRRRSDVIWTIGASTRAAIAECQFQFQHYKWNCSTVERDSSVFGKKFIRGGTPELAFVQALTAASAVLGVSRACASGAVNCGCSLNMMEESAYTSNDFKMNGCTESTKFALHFVHRFGDGEETGMSDPKAKMKVYNNKAGRSGLVKQSLTRCKCHGLSGSCTMKTCWRFLPNLRAVGNSLKGKYDGAIKVDFDPKGQMMPVDNLQRKPSRANLIYFEDSPDGCTLDISRGLFGTSERLCNSTSSEGIDSCDILCCGNGHTTSRVSTTYKCECTFQWCCEVKCKMCQEWKAVSRCTALKGIGHPDVSSNYNGSWWVGMGSRGHSGVEGVDAPPGPSIPQPTSDLLLRESTNRMRGLDEGVASSRGHKGHGRWNVLY